MTALDVDAIIERAVRREAALRSHNHDPRWGGIRADADSPLDRPTLRWPSERHLVPARCWQCGAGRASFDRTNLPYGTIKVGTIDCVMCSRVIVNVRADGTRPIPGGQHGH